MGEMNEIGGEEITYEKLMKEWFPEEERPMPPENAEKWEHNLMQFSEYFKEVFVPEEEKEKFDYSTESIKDLEGILSRDNRDFMLEISAGEDAKNSNFRTFVDFAACYLGETIISSLLKERGLQAEWRFISPPARSEVVFKRGEGLGQEVTIKPSDLILQKISDESIDNQKALTFHVEDIIGEWGKAS